MGPFAGSKQRTYTAGRPHLHSWVAKRVLPRIAAPASFASLAGVPKRNPLESDDPSGRLWKKASSSISFHWEDKFIGPLPLPGLAPE